MTFLLPKASSFSLFIQYFKISEIILLKKYRNIRTFSKETESEMAEGLNNKHVRNGQQEEVGLSKDRYLHLKRKEGIDLF